MNTIRKLAFIGGGNMAAALIGGMIKRGLAADCIIVADPSALQRERLTQDFGVKTTGENARATEDADVVVLAVKPQQMREAALTVADHLRVPYPLVISVAAGIPHAALVEWLGAGVPVVRAMPNRPALNGCGATGLYAPSGLSVAYHNLAEIIMAAVGYAAWVEEERQMDIVTALSGSGPAYFFLLMEALEAAAQSQGLPAEVARRLTLETAFGAAQMARDTDESPAELRRQVTSKGGTTAAALAVLDKAKFSEVVAAAIAAADRRSSELAAQFGSAL